MDSGTERIFEGESSRDAEHNDRGTRPGLWEAVLMSARVVFLSMRGTSVFQAVRAGRINDHATDNWICFFPSKANSSV